MDSQRADNLVLVLVRARNPSNIGAVARAMHDLGFRHLRIVNEYPVPFQAARSAVDAASVLYAATEHATVAEAVADCTLVLGTTAVGERVLEHPLHLLPGAARLAAEELRQGRVALLFGSEKTGLSNDELSHCHALVTIPMNPVDGGHLSMNLGQAAAVCLWQMALELGAYHPSPVSSASQGEGETRVQTGELERLTTMLAETMQQSGYARRNPANAREVVVRRLVRRMLLTPGDAAVWTGLLRQLLYALDSPAGDAVPDRSGAESS